MKFRKGFVTNSSSSSYVLIGIPLKDKYELLNAKTPVAVVRTAFGEGEFIFDVSPDMISTIMDNWDMFSVIDSHYFAGDSGYPISEPLTLQVGACVYHGEMDQHSPCGLDELKQFIEEHKQDE